MDDLDGRLKWDKALKPKDTRGGKQVDDPLEDLPKDSPQFKNALGCVMGLPPATALDVYNTILPKAERYPYKSRKRAVRKGG